MIYLSNRREKNIINYKGKFTPKNPSKYIGDRYKIIYRSSWEMIFMAKLDKDPTVKKWSSEEVRIPYISPIDGKRHTYYVDFFIEYTDGKKILIEIKPAKETKPPQVKTKKTKRYLKEVITWGINEAKWEAAKQYCINKGWEFLIYTEKELGIKK